VRTNLHATAAGTAARLRGASPAWPGELRDRGTHRLRAACAARPCGCVEGDCI